MSFIVKTSECDIFLKLNDGNNYPLMFEREAEGLVTLSGKSAIVIPMVKAKGIINQYQYLLLEYLEKGRPNSDFWNQFGRALATQHINSNDLFGWQNDNYIGSLVQSNKQYADWAIFYANERIGPLVKKLFDKGSVDRSFLILSESLEKKLMEIFPGEPPALLHGDLWSGNFMVTANGLAAIYDPAVYYGHREMDIGMTKLFGGFNAEFYQAYHEQYPLEKGWQRRISLTQLYPLLVHAVLFGGSYISTCRQHIKEWS